MMERNRRRLAICCVSLALALSGCDDTPNPAFEQKLKDEIYSNYGDAYLILQSVPRLYRYARAEPKQRAAVAQQDALGYRSGYEAMLEKLNTEPAVPGLDELSALCKPLYAQALGFQATPSQDLIAASAGLSEQLSSCRDRAIKAQEVDDVATAQRAHLLRRFASSAMVLVAVATVAHGAEAEGLELWRRADELTSKDKPEFKVKPRMLLNN